MLNHNFLDKTLVHKLSTTGIDSSSLALRVKNDLDFMLELWRSQGLSIKKEFNNYFFQTKLTPLKETTFCIVDIETNGSCVEKHQIIELAAIKVKDGNIIDKFKSFVKCSEINEYIVAITGITTDHTRYAPKLKDVLYDFRVFLDDSIFVAHDVRFDYNFISKSMQKVGLEPLLNRSLCTIALAQRTIEAYRYKLSYLNELLSLHPDAKHHRAMCDVLATYELFKLSLSKIDKNLQNCEDLIYFVKHEKMLKRPLIDPLADEQTIR
ncbi:MAG: 3'-5' exonuclease [Sulfurimonas sp.]|jgi:DNA polymerase-3 subunit epsilon|nr:3'-5' exonuclease [Sulfurimonadaceae bacterium]